MVLARVLIYGTYFIRKKYELGEEAPCSHIYHTFCWLTCVMTTLINTEINYTLSGMGW